MRPVVFVGLLIASAPALAVPCWDAAAQRHGIAPELLYAVARTESNLDAAAMNRSHRQRTGSYDIGLMQINSRHLPQLARHGIQEADLSDACLNLQVGAWLLADLFARHGVSWDTVGAYNAACSQLQGDDCRRARASYAWKVYRRLPTSQPGASEQPPRRSASTAPLAQGLMVRVAP